MGERKIEYARKYLFPVNQGSEIMFKNGEDTINDELDRMFVPLPKNGDLVDIEDFIWFSADMFSSQISSLRISSYTSYEPIQKNGYSRKLKIIIGPESAQLPSELTSLLEKNGFEIFKIG